MMAKSSLLALVRCFGVFGLAFVLYAWLHPDVLANWTSRRSVPEAGSVQGVRKTPDAVPPKPFGAADADKSADTSAAYPGAAMVSSSRRITSTEAAVARWIGTRYGVAPDAIAPLVAEADNLTGTYRFSPNLLIAVMAIESNFHPYIQSEAGAQGLMQVMPKIHSKRYEKFGGKTAFMDPIVSLRVGAEILRDCIKLKDGSETEGLRFYFGGGPSSDTYIEKVRAEQRRLNLVARGAPVPTTD
jgi:soluble lytic murein transglycosylase-like protein